MLREGGIARAFIIVSYVPFRLPDEDANGDIGCGCRKQGDPRRPALTTEKWPQATATGLAARRA